MKVVSVYLKMMLHQASNKKRLSYKRQPFLLIINPRAVEEVEVAA